METRASHDDAVIAALLGVSSGSGVIADASVVGALETCVSLYARSFLLADITPKNSRTATITPTLLSSIVRNILRHGESLHLLSVTPEGGLVLTPCSSWDVSGNYDPASWVIRADLAGPSMSSSITAPYDSFLHIMYAYRAGMPWKGVSPLAWCPDTAQLMAGLERRLSEESCAPISHILPIPTDGGADGEDDDPHAALKQDLRLGGGRTLLLESTAAGWGDGRGAAPQRDWKSSRIGSSPPSAVTALREDAISSIMSALGCPPSLFLANSDGTSQRESLRRWLHTSALPTATLISTQLGAALDVDIKIGLDRILASDLSGRSRSVMSLVGAGVSLEKALEIALLSEDE